MNLGDSSNQSQFSPGQKTKKMFLVFSQWVADNCHHNANTLDGNGEFQDKPINPFMHNVVKWPNIL